MGAYKRVRVAMTTNTRRSGLNVVMYVREQWLEERTRRVANFHAYVGVVTEEAMRAGASLHIVVPGKRKAGAGVTDLLATIADMETADVVVVQRGSAMGNLVFLPDSAVVVAPSIDCTKKCETPFIPTGWIPTGYRFIPTKYKFTDPHWLEVDTHGLQMTLSRVLFDQATDQIE